MKLLVVDAVRHERESLTGFLDLQQGLQVTGAVENAKEAVRIATRSKPDLIIINIDHANDVGPAALQQLARLSYHPMIILLTLHAGADARSLAVEIGALALIETSAGIDPLVETILSVRSRIDCR